MQILSTDASASRTQQAILVGLVGLAVNFVLGGVKVFIGWQSGFLSVMGDGFNNITDMGSVLLLMMTFYYAAKPSDTEHPFGHGRLEYINSTVMAAVILYVGITLGRESIEKILHPEDTHFTPFLSSASSGSSSWHGGIKEPAKGFPRIRFWPTAPTPSRICFLRQVSLSRRSWSISSACTSMV